MPQLAVEGYENLKPEKSKPGKEKLHERKQQGLEKHKSCEENPGGCQNHWVNNSWAMPILY